MSRKFIFGGSYTSFIWDTDALAYFNANTAITLDTDKLAIDAFYKGLKSDGIYTKLKAMYFPKWGSAANNKWNLLNPVDSNSAFRLVFNGGWTHASTGVTPNGTNGYANTFFTPSSSQILNSNGIGIDIRTNITETSSDPVIMGSFNTLGQCSLIAVQNSNTFTRLNSNSISALNASKIGLFSAQRTSSTSTTLYKNTVSLANGNSGGELPSVPIFIGNMSTSSGTPYNNGYTKNQIDFVYISQGLTSTEVSNLHARLSTLKTHFGL